MKLRILFATSLLSFVACGDDPEGGTKTDTSAETDATTGEVESETSAETIEETAPETTPETIAETSLETIAETSPETIAETSPETIEETTQEVIDETSDTEVVEPECRVDEYCQLLGIIVPPNNCTAVMCVEGACTTGPRECDDGDPCTTDMCDPFNGCIASAATIDVGDSRFTLCPVPLTQPEAAAACFEHGGTLALVDAIDAGAIEPLMRDSATLDAWVASFSDLICPVERRVIVQPCKTLQTVDAGICTEIVDCAEALPFVCEVTCDDGDPCTVDFVDIDGLCASKENFCDDGDACTFDSCQEGVGCTHQNPRGQCIDDNPCTTDSCIRETGACSNVPVRQTWDATHALLECPGGDTFSAARNWCAVNGGVLANPTNDVQRATLGAFVGTVGPVWAPLQKTGDTWAWVDAAGSGEPSWCPSEPSGADLCGEWLEAACASDASCDETRAFACTIDTSIP